MSEMVKEITPEEFRETGLLWFINMQLHAFGFAIVSEISDGGEERLYAATTKFRGFSEEANDEGYKKMANHAVKSIGWDGSCISEEQEQELDKTRLKVIKSRYPDTEYNIHVRADAFKLCEEDVLKQLGVANAMEIPTYLYRRALELTSEWKPSRELSGSLMDIIID